MKVVYVVLGSISLFLGVLGIFLPVLPTTPFLLLSAALYLRGSERLYQWLLHHPQLGPYIQNFLVHKAIPLRAKIYSVSLLWITILFTSLFVVPIVWVKILLLGIAVGVSIHILSFKTLK